MPSPDRRSASGLTPFFPTLATTGATWHRQSPAADLATTCRDAVLEVAESDETITNCRLDGCRLDSSFAVATSHWAPGVNAMSRVAGCVALAGPTVAVAVTVAVKAAATGATAGHAASPNTIAAATQRRFMPTKSTKQHSGRAFDADVSRHGLEVQSNGAALADIRCGRGIGKRRPPAEGRDLGFDPDT